ncbi:hypothetical protein AMECASPLE_019514 [Ameca splendens]|uniref:C2 domain-containing protein n=1 Tax=Ameca splendens TaxID=208324 RepID=A0ABV0ZC49_9TELE
MYLSWELVKDKPDLKCWSPIFGYPQAVSHIYVKGAEIYQHSDQMDGIELYMTISCEGQSVSSTIKKNTLNPDFEISAVFYRKKLSKPIKVQVWSTNLEEDNFLGQVVLPGLPTDISDPQQLQLKKNGLNMAGNMVGNISLRIVTANQLTAI